MICNFVWRVMSYAAWCQIDNVQKLGDFLLNLKRRWFLFQQNTFNFVIWIKVFPLHLYLHWVVNQHNMGNYFVCEIYLWMRETFRYGYHFHWSFGELLLILWSKELSFDKDWSGKKRI